MANMAKEEIILNIVYFRYGLTPVSHLQTNRGPAFTCISGDVYSPDVNPIPYIFAY